CCCTPPGWPSPTPRRVPGSLSRLRTNPTSPACSVRCAAMTLEPRLAQRAHPSHDGCPATGVPTMKSILVLPALALLTSAATAQVVRGGDLITTDYNSPYAVWRVDHTGAVTSLLSGGLLNGP